MKMSDGRDEFAEMSEIEAAARWAAEEVEDQVMAAESGTRTARSSGSQAGKATGTVRVPDTVTLGKNRASNV